MNYSNLELSIAQLQVIDAETYGSNYLVSTNQHHKYNEIFQITGG